MSRRRDAKLVIPGRRRNPRTPNPIRTNGGYWIPALAAARRGRNDQLRVSELHPRPRGLGLVFEAGDLALFHHGEADVVEALQQALLAVRLDVEPHHAAIGASDLLLFEIDRQRGVGAALGVVEQLLEILG